MISLNRERFDPSRNRLLDLGAGDGGSYEKLASRLPGLDYTGLDIAGSPEVSRRTRNDLTFATYDGRTAPFDDGVFDVVFCKQVLEHVRHPDAVVGEVARVLRPGGVFVGSVSQLEPYHSHSIFNWTAYGLHCVFSDAGLRLEQLRPGIDGVALTLRRIFGRDKFSAAFRSASLFNHYLDSEMAKRPHKERNFQKLVIAGHISFLAVRP